MINYGRRICGAGGGAYLARVVSTKVFDGCGRIIEARRFILNIIGLSEAHDRTITSV